MGARIDLQGYEMKVPPEIASLIPYQPGKPISETQREYGLQTKLSNWPAMNRRWVLLSLA